MHGNKHFSKDFELYSICKHNCASNDHFLTVIKIYLLVKEMFGTDTIKKHYHPLAIITDLLK